MAGRTRTVHMLPACGNGPSGFSREVPDYAPRPEDYAWVARELGDVEPRVTWIDKMAETDPEMALAFAMFQGQEPILGDGIPVESLGRNSDG